MTFMHVPTGEIFTLFDAISTVRDAARRGEEDYSCRTYAGARKKVLADESLVRVRRTRTAAEKEKYGDWVEY